MSNPVPSTSVTSTPGSSIGLDDILITAALAHRPPRTPNLQAENQALQTIAQQLVEQSPTLLQTLVTVAKELCQAGTAGVSLLETTANGEEIFRWVALAGALADYEGGTVQRSSSPCGVCLDRQAPQLYAYPERYFTYLQSAKLVITEGLVIPLMAADRPLGTIWIVSHDEARRFDPEDVRILTSLANLTAAALQSVQLRQTMAATLQREQTVRQEVDAAHHALNDLTQRAVDILESITDAFVCVDHDWRITYINQEAARLAQRSPGEMIGKSYREMQSSEVATVIATVIEQTYTHMIAEPSATHFEYFDQSSGMWLEIHAYSCKSGFSIYFRDITERKHDQAKRQQAEAALRESESRFRLIVESAKEYAIFTLDLQGHITSWNAGAERLLGYKEAEIIGHHSRIIFTPEDQRQGRAEQEIQTALTQGRAEDNRWHVRQDGSRFFASGLMMQLRDQAGTDQAGTDQAGSLKGLVKILQDVTAAHQAAEREQFLSEASALLAQTIDYKATLSNIARLAVPFLADFCFFDLLNSSDQIERVGWHQNDLTQQHWVEQSQQYKLPQAWEAHPVAHVLVSGQANLVPVVTAEWLQAAIQVDDHLQFMQDCQVQSLITVPLIAHGHQLGALTVCFTPSSNRHYTQTDLTVAEELGYRAALALDSARLYQQVQEANRMKDEFLTALSHELRSPLNPILGWVQMIRRGDLDAAKTAQAWAAIERNARLQAQLVGDLLDVSRSLQGKLRLNVGMVNLKAVIQAAIETVELAAQSKSIQIEARLGAASVVVKGDATRLQQMVWNLLSNAIKFTPAGGRVEVQVESVANGSGRAQEQAKQPRPSAPSAPPLNYSYVQITVRDTGMGIPPHFLPYVFDYFRQAEGGTTRRFGGLGLGLAIVRQIVEAHGGSVWAESLGEGQGASFTVQLPLRSTEAAPAPAAQPLEDIDLQGTQVLVVDNEPDGLEFVTFVLEQTGASVISATSAAEALKLFTQSPPDLLVSDIGMPDQDGYLLMQQVRALPIDQGGQVPAIALTAYAGDMDQRQALAAGFQRHLAKPIEPETLVRTIAELVQHNHVRKLR